MSQNKVTSKHKNAWVSLLKVSVTLSKHIDDALQTSGKVQFEVYDVLLSLEDAPGGKLTMTELAETVVVSPSGITRIIDRMIIAGFVKREANTVDRRSKFACITEKGIEARKLASPIVLSAMQEVWASKMTEEEASVIHQIMRRMVISREYS